MYRNLRFKSYDDILSEIAKLEKAKNVKTVGLWSYGQILQHVAVGPESNLTGKIKLAPWLVRVIFGKFFKNKILKKDFMEAGLDNPEAAKERIELDPKPELEKLKTLINQLKTHKGELFEHPFYGKSDLQETEKLNALHIAHHFSYINYE